MMRNRRQNYTPVMVFIGLLFSAWTSTGSAAESATIAISTPMKNSASLLGGKKLRDLQPGTAVTVLSTKSTYSQVELADEAGVKGWVLTASISRNKDVTAGVSSSNAGSKGMTDSKAQIAGSMGGVAKGFANLSDQAQLASSSGKGKAASLKDGVGAVTKGKPGAGEAIDEVVGGSDAGDAMSAATDASAKFKGKSASTLEKIEALKVSEDELSGFMKEGGLRSRLIR